jgi:hypothetical protein
MTIEFFRTGLIKILFYKLILFSKKTDDFVLFRELLPVKYGSPAPDEALVKEIALPHNKEYKRGLSVFLIG